MTSTDGVGDPPPAPGPEQPAPSTRGQSPAPYGAPPPRGIVAQGVRRAFGHVMAVRDISFEAPPGQVTALIGPNGAGKTTLMLMLATLLVPDSGRILVDGFDPVTHPRQVRTRIGWMPDGFGTWDALTVREVLHTIGAAYDMPRAAAHQRTDELLRLVHLEELADQRARVLSRGQRQRLGLARALIHDPSTLVLDEPASGLDPRSRIELRDILRGLAGEGRTVLVSSHILTELQEVADRVVIVARGATVQSRPLAAGKRRSGGGAWRVAALELEPLGEALARHGVPHDRTPGGATVQVASEEAAADLLALLVRDGVRVTCFEPLHSALEAAYLAATEDRS